MLMQKHVEVDCHFIQEKVGNKDIVDIYEPVWGEVFKRNNWICSFRENTDLVVNI